MRWARRSAWLLWAATLVVAAMGLALLIWDWSAPVPAGFFGIRGFDGLDAVCFGWWARSNSPPSSTAGGIRGPRSPRRRDAAGELWIWIPLVTLITVYLFLLFPDGHLPSPRWRPVGCARQRVRDHRGRGAVVQSRIGRA